MSPLMPQKVVVAQWLVGAEGIYERIELAEGNITTLTKNK